MPSSSGEPRKQSELADSGPDGDDREPSGWLFGLIEVILVVVLVALAVPWWAGLAVAGAIGLAVGTAQRRWPTI